MKDMLIQKLTSRKLWAAIAGIVIGVAAAFGVEAGEYTEIAGIVTSAISVATYIFSEGQVDAAAAGRIAAQNREDTHAEQ